MAGKEAIVCQYGGRPLAGLASHKEAAAQYRKAFELDPAVAKGSTLDAYLASKTAPTP